MLLNVDCVMKSFLFIMALLPYCLIALLPACSFAVQLSLCHEQAGLKAIDENNLTEAYELLKGCEFADASGRALHNLNILVFPKGLGSYDSLDSRIIASKKLSCQAALKGYTISIRRLANIYKSFDEYLGLEPNDKISLCLSNIPSLNSSEYVNPKDVEYCLSLNPSIDPSNECF